jgi:serine/threonine protein kinase
VDANWTIKVSDFGLSRFTSGAASNLSTLGKLRGTYAYSAPEVYFGDAFTTKADVYSVGIIFWELAVRCLTKEYAMPYSEYPELVFDFQIIIQVAKHEKRPTIPSACPKDYRDLITACWAQTADARPEIPSVLARLEEMIAAHNPNKK